MAYKPVPEKYRKSAPLIFNVDFFDFATGAGYKKYYLVTTEDNTSVKYNITTDNTLISPSNVSKISGSVDVDFDLTFNNVVTIANASSTINYTVGADGARTFEIVWTIYHVRGAVETSLGTVTRTTTSAANQWWREAVQIELARKTFSKGDILRVNMVTTSSNPGGSFPRILIDPSGHWTNTEVNTGASIPSSAIINIPFEVDA